MKFAKFLDRENAYKILCSTFSDNSDADAKPVNVVLFPDINIISRDLGDRSLRSFLREEYINHHKGLVRYLALLYVFIVVPTFSKFYRKRATILIDRSIESFFIIYCNQRIRLFDLDKGKVRVFLKTGYSKKEFDYELNLRERFGHSVMVPVTNSANFMYEEPMLVGTPLARIDKSSRDFENGCLDVFHKYDDFQKCASRVSDSYDYIKKLRREIIDMGFEGQRDLVSWFEELDFTTGKSEIITSISHGDLHHGNVWICDGGAMIIDWESIAFRAVIYDEFFLLNGTRPDFLIDSNYIAVRAAFIATQADKFGRHISLECPVIRSVLILEDFRYRLSEIAKLPESMRLSDLKLLFDNNTRRNFNV